MLNKIKLFLQQIISLPFLFNINDVINFYYCRKKFSKKYDSFLHHSKKIGLDYLPTGTYEWDIWRSKLKNFFSVSVPLNFLHNRLIAGTMVYGSSKFQSHKLNAIESIYNRSLIKKTLKESLIGIPLITNLKYFSSENSIHQLYHISSYLKITSKDLINSKTIIEWGGGYGCLSRIIKKINKDCTYIILDLPELSALQYVYLSSIFGKNYVNFIDNNINFQKNKINLVSSDYLIKSNIKLQADTFISNWALTECGKDYQKFILKNKFFNAKNILISSIDDENNFIINSNDFNFDYKVPINVLSKGNYYLMK